jgi:hypothetical protein
MKSVVLNVIALLLMLFSFSTCADKISIKGEPVLLYEKGGVYFVPETYNASSQYNYVTFDNSKKVCYQVPQPQLSALNMKVIDVNFRGKQYRWICYNFDATYFTETP